MTERSSLWEDSGVEEDAQRRLAANEAMCREVNEAIERGQWPGEEDAPMAFRCECARLGCDQMIQLSVRDYERIREDARHFAVAPGHEVAELEVVIERQRGYFVVEKLDLAGSVAEATAPRD
jgi:hypothetical protein